VEKLAPPAARPHDLLCAHGRRPSSGAVPLLHLGRTGMLSIVAPSHKPNKMGEAVREAKKNTPNTYCLKTMVVAKLRVTHILYISSRTIFFVTLGSSQNNFLLTDFKPDLLHSV
jgi:hypothetical protein